MSSPKDNIPLRGNYRPSNPTPFVQRVTDEIDAKIEAAYGENERHFMAKKAFSETFLKQLRVLLQDVESAEDLEANDETDMSDVQGDIIAMIEPYKKDKTFDKFPFVDLLIVAGAEIGVFETEKDLIQLFVKKLLSQKTIEKKKAKAKTKSLWVKNSVQQDEYRHEKWNKIDDDIAGFYETKEQREELDEFKEHVSAQWDIWVEEYKKKRKNSKFLTYSFECPAMIELIKKISISIAEYNTQYTEQLDAKYGDAELEFDFPWSPLVQCVGASTGAFADEKTFDYQFSWVILAIKQTLINLQMLYRKGNLFREKLLYFHAELKKDPDFQIPEKLKDEFEFEIEQGSESKALINPRPNFEEITENILKTIEEKQVGFRKKPQQAAAAAAGPSRSQSRSHSRHRSPPAAAAAAVNILKPKRKKPLTSTEKEASAAPPAAPPAAPVNILQAKRKKPLTSTEKEASAAPPAAPPAAAPVNILQAKRKKQTEREASAARRAANKPTKQKQRISAKVLEDAIRAENALLTATAKEKAARAESAKRKASADRRSASVPKKTSAERRSASKSKTRRRPRDPSRERSLPRRTAPARSIHVQGEWSGHPGSYRAEAAAAAAAAENPQVQFALPAGSIDRKRRELAIILAKQSADRRRVLGRPRSRSISSNRSISQKRHKLSAARLQFFEEEKQLAELKKHLSEKRRQISANRHKLSADRRQFSVEQQRGGRGRGGGNRVNGECPEGCVKDKRKPCKPGQVRSENGRCKNIHR